MKRDGIQIKKIGNGCKANSKRYAGKFLRRAAKIAIRKES